MMKRTVGLLHFFSLFMLKQMPENSFTLPSFAKINLFLRVFGKRADGFHEICTIFQTVSLCDYLTFSEAQAITLTCSDDKIPIDDENLIVKAAKVLRENYAVKKGAKIHLEKHIPAPGGLGGGSSNAAVALLALVRLWNITVSFEELRAIGKTLGSDVPFFFSGGTALGTGRGTEIFPLEDFGENYILIAALKIDISTGKAFARLSAPDLTNKSSKSILQICRAEANSLYLRQTALTNDFERVIFEIEPRIGKIKEKLFSCGAKRSLLSGSGASVFGIFETDEERRNALELLQEENCRVFPVETISRLAYHNFLGFGKDFV
ncbi:MAG: 4-diphosphocytidyl-2-C-methyl-D-erythritol kinase [uncultured Pyrinomonadaceae bacterium]|uniref:4-diphosphocytidyl-2-C-methyl-D-erythritol kinase n=1 Tax=uncultured Pyrinomonadaceae bacterium TaxID=2283094 RepID=A0A6J4NAJ5_9BACT|nr:MAG: 4-diphosphocytidyl-2-C-methyl-D-erythritol kinase [uncultured Pyrinomonadaceae bacterium]